MTAAETIAAMERLPYADLEGLLGGQRPLILAPHADDESLGCGGLIAECCRQGRNPVVAILTDGSGSHPGSKRYPPLRLAAVREAEALAAVERLGLDERDLVFFRYPDTALPCDGEVVLEVVELANARQCRVIFAPWIYDPHCDHEAAAILAEHAARALMCKVLSYPVWGRLGADPALVLPEPRGWRLEIGDHVAAKQEAIASHASQYSGLIDDSPDGFRLPPDLLRVFERSYEIFLETADASRYLAQG